jgi:uncharacterized protein
MTTFLIALAVFALAIALMAVGVIFSNRCIRGSCGGLAGLRDDHGRVMCDACTQPSEECGGVEEKAAAESSGRSDWVVRCNRVGESVQSRREAIAMQSTIHVKTRVLPGGRIEITAPELNEGDEVEVNVLIPSGASMPPRRSALEIIESLPPGPRSYASWEEFEQRFQQERDSWER